MGATAASRPWTRRRSSWVCGRRRWRPRPLPDPGREGEVHGYAEEEDGGVSRRQSVPLVRNLPCRRVVSFCSSLSGSDSCTENQRPYSCRLHQPQRQSIFPLQYIVNSDRLNNFIFFHNLIETVNLT